MCEDFNYEFTHVKFTNGYSNKCPSFIIELKDIQFGKAKPEWSDNWQGEVIVIKLGNIVTLNNN